MRGTMQKSAPVRHLNRCRGDACLPGKHAKEGRQTCGASNWKCNRIRNNTPGSHVGAREFSLADTNRPKKSARPGPAGCSPMSRAGSDLSAATAVVPAARRRSVDGSLETYGDESALERLRFFFEDIALSRCVPSFPATLCG